MAPEAFERCRRNNGKIRTVSGPNKMMGLKAGQYKHICVKNGKVYPGEVKTKQES